MGDILAKNPDLTKIIKKAVKRIGENHALARDKEGMVISNEGESYKYTPTKGRHPSRLKESVKETKVIEEALKAAADEMAQKLVLENTIDNMVKETLQGQTAIGNTLKSVGAGFVDKQGSSDTLTKFTKRQEMGEQQEMISEENSSVAELMERGTPWTNLTTAERQMVEEAGYDKDSWTKAISSSSDEAPKVNETTTDLIKKLVNKKLKDKLAEANLSPSKTVPGLDAYNKAIKKSKTETDSYHKDVKKKFKDYSNFDGNTNPEFPHQVDSKTDPDNIGYRYYRNTDDDQEFIDDFGYPGLQDFDVHNQDMKRLTDYLEGSSETGNAQEDKDGETLGNVVQSNLGKIMKKSVERRKEKIAAEKAAMTNLRGYSPDVQKVKQVKESVQIDTDVMKKLWSYNEKTQ